MTNFYVHPSSFVDRGVTIFEDVKIWHFCHIMEEATIGKNCVLGQNVFVGRGVTIGQNCRIQNNVSVFEGVTLESEVFCGPSTVFTNVINPRSEISRKEEFRSTLVKKGASIGANATIICGNTIGKYSLIGAGSVVTKDIPDFALVIGTPSKIVGWVCRCGEKLYFNNSESSKGTIYGICNSCGSQYRKCDDIVEEIR